MYNMFYSPTIEGFYPGDAIERYKKAGSWPDDAMPLDDDYYGYLLEGQSKGKWIVKNSDGYPVLEDPPPLSKEELVRLANIQKSNLIQIASNKIAPLQDAVDFDMATEEEKIKLKSWKMYRIFLNRVDTSTAPDITWPTSPDDA